MQHKYLPLFACFVLTLLLVARQFLTTPHPTYRSSLTFSNTATWDAVQDARSKESLIYPESLFATIRLSPPPANDSAETAGELALLLSYQKDRNLADLRDINDEINLDPLYFAGHTMREFMQGSAYPHTAALLRDSFHDVTVLLLRQKRHFDRVRPSVLEPSLTPAIEVPGHPAYPSGHSAQTHFLALVFTELDPAHAAYYGARADQIAHNREIAGLHYPSDSRAGTLLAEQVFAALMTDARFTQLLAAAKEEWRLTQPARALTTR